MLQVAPFNAKMQQLDTEVPLNRSHTVRKSYCGCLYPHLSYDPKLVAIGEAQNEDLSAHGVLLLPLTSQPARMSALLQLMSLTRGQCQDHE